MANDNAPTTKTKKKEWYKNPVYVILWLVFFFPIGIYGVWKYPDWGNKTKWILTAIPVVLIFFVMISASLAPPTIKLKNSSTGEEILTADYKIEGKVTPSSSKVRVNGNDASVDSTGDFTYTVILQDGINEIVVVATNAGKTTQVNKVVTKLSEEEIAQRKADADAKAKVEADKKAAEAEAKAAEEAAKNQPKTSFEDGTFLVNKDIQAGTYRTSGGNTCYYERLSGLSGSLDDIISNDLATGQAVITIAPTDVAFKSKGCGTWTKL